jgi:hypothetical protein
MAMVRRRIVIPVAVAVALVAAGVTAWQAGVFGSSGAAHSVAGPPAAVGATSATPYQVAEDAYVNSAVAWKGLPTATRSALLAKLRAKEQQFRAAGSAVFPPASAFTVRPGSPAGSAAALGAGSGNVLLAARTDAVQGALATDFGATSFDDQSLSLGSAVYEHRADIWGWTPCVSAPTSLPGTPTLDMCGGQVLGGGGYVSQLGMTGAIVTASGLAATKAELPVTASFTNHTGQRARVIVTASEAAVSVSLHAEIGVGCDPSQLSYATPGSGSLAPPLPNPPVLSVTDCLGTIGSVIPVSDVPKAIHLLSTGLGWLNAFRDAVTNVADKSQLATSPALQVCASGQTISDVVSIITELGWAGLPTCQAKPLPTWTGTVAAGQTVDFTAAPITQASSYGAGYETTAQFAFLHLHVTQCPATGPCQPGWSAPAEVAAGPITSVSCSGQFCAAVGATGPYTRQAKGFAVTYNDGTWSAPVPLGTGNSYAVSCPTSTWCEAVTDTGYAYAYRNGSWSGADDIYPAANAVHIRYPTADTINGVSCANPRFCAAVTAKGAALTWDGTRWSAPAAIGLPAIQDAPAFMYSLATIGLSCPSATFCLTAASSREEPTAAAWNGTHWSPAPAPPAILNDAFKSVSCTSAQFCMAVGGDHASGDIASAWNGATWSALANPATGEAPLGFGTVSCASARFCAALDGGAGANGYLATTSRGSAISAWTNGTWDGPELIDPNGLLDALSCSSAGFCLAADTIGDVYIYTTSTGPCPYLPAAQAAAAAGQPVTAQAAAAQPPQITYLYGDMGMLASYTCLFYGPSAGSGAQTQYQSSVYIAVGAPIPDAPAFLEQIRQTAQAELSQANGNLRAQAIPGIGVTNVLVPPLPAITGQGEGNGAEPATLYLLGPDNIVQIQLQSVNTFGKPMSSSTLNALTDIGKTVAANL